MKKKVLIGFIGAKLDKGNNEDRWKKWRPSVSLCQHEDLKFDRFDLIYQPIYKSLKNTIISDVEEISPSTEIIPHKMTIRDPWAFEEVYSAFADFVDSYQFDTDKEEYYVNITTGSHVMQICFYLLTESRFIPAKLIQSSPGGGHPRGKYQVIDLDLSKYDVIMTRFNSRVEEGKSFLKAGIETKNKSFNNLIEKIELVASRSKDPLLLMGPTGAGKSELARRIFALKKEKNLTTGDLVEVNCGTIRGDSAMSTLFGHVKGAFTGAQAARTGLIAAANGGVLFLDEIGELGMDEQTLLLKAIEEKRFLPMGADKEVYSDFQLIAGTNRDLFSEVQKGNFRGDLLARINIWSFDLPGLKDRKEDIDPNLDYEIKKYAQRTGNQISFTIDARKLFLKMAHDYRASWEGNFRDLNTLMTRLGTLSNNGRITADLVKLEMEVMYAGWEKLKAKNIKSSTINLLDYVSEEQEKNLDLFDRAQLQTVLEVVHSTNSLSEAGRVLFAESRKVRTTRNDADRLRKYLAKFGI